MGITVPLLVVGWVALAQTGPKFQLSAEFSTRQGGIRAIAETRYVCKRDGREIWSAVRRERYRYHWFARDGSVFVMTSPFPGPGGGDALWIADPEGVSLASWGLSQVLQGMPRGNKGKPWDSSLRLDLGKSSLDEFRDGTLRRLRLRTFDGGEARLLVWQGPERLEAFQRWVAPGKDRPPLLERCVMDASYALPERRPLLPESFVDLWTARARSKQPDWVWIQAARQGDRLGGFDAERPLGSVPDLVVRTAGGRMFWLEFTARSAVARFTDRLGRPLKTVDLVQLGGFKDSAEARTRLRWHQASALESDGYVPLVDHRWPQGSPEDKIEILDDRGRRFVFIASGGDGKIVRFRADVQKGLAARRPKTEWPLGMSRRKALEVRSPNRRFVLRYEQVVAPKPSPIMQVTFAALVKDGGKTVPVELWSGVTSSAPAASFISDSGRSYSFFFDRLTDSGTGKAFDHGFVMVKEPGGRQIAGHVFNQWERWKTNAEARRELRLDRVRIRNLGSPIDRSVEGVSIRQFPEEEIEIPHRSGGRSLYRITHSPYMEGEVMSLLEPKRTRP